MRSFLKNTKRRFLRVPTRFCSVLSVFVCFCLFSLVFASFVASCCQSVAGTRSS
jgi:hypothetical protein